MTQCQAPLTYCGVMAAWGHGKWKMTVKGIFNLYYCEIGSMPCWWSVLIKWITARGHYGKIIVIALSAIALSVWQKPMYRNTCCCDRCSSHHTMSNVSKQATPWISANLFSLKFKLTITSVLRMCEKLDQRCKSLMVSYIVWEAKLYPLWTSEVGWVAKLLLKYRQKELEHIPNLLIVLTTSR